MNTNIAQWTGRVVPISFSWNWVENSWKRLVTHSVAWIWMVCQKKLGKNWVLEAKTAKFHFLGVFQLFRASEAFFWPPEDLRPLYVGELGSWWVVGVDQIEKSRFLEPGECGHFCRGRSEFSNFQHLSPVWAPVWCSWVMAKQYFSKFRSLVT